MLLPFISSRLISIFLLFSIPPGVDSGGNPKNIPDLTFEQFKGFHSSYYHPSNSRVYFYGDDDPMKVSSILFGCAFRVP